MRIVENEKFANSSTCGAYLMPGYYFYNQDGVQIVTPIQLIVNGYPLTENSQKQDLCQGEQHLQINWPILIALLDTCPSFDRTNLKLHKRYSSTCSTTLQTHNEIHNIQLDNTTSGNFQQSQESIHIIPITSIPKIRKRTMYSF